MQHNKIEAKKQEILEKQLEMHKKQDRRAGMLLSLGGVLTALMYFMFMKHLYLGEAITWAAYFHEWHSALDFILMFVIVVMSAIFLAWVKHHAYLHFGLYGSVALVLFTVIGFALFAEFFSSSASQDTKSRVLLENDKAYQATLAPVASVTPALSTSSNAAAIAKAEQTYARCVANLGKPGYKHCDGDKATLDSLKASDAAALQAAKEIAVQTNAATTKMNHDRQDKLKADSYNAVIVSIAQAIGSLTATDYKDNIKAATVLTMLIVAIAFEILHHFLSHAKERAQNAVYAIELELAKYEGMAAPQQPESVVPQNDSAFKNTGVGFTANLGKSPTAHHSPAIPETDKPMFKYQQTPPADHSGFVGFVDTNTRKKSASDERPFYGFKDAKKQSALDALNLAHGSEDRKTRENRTINKEPSPALPANQKTGLTGIRNPVLGKSESVYELPLAAENSRVITRVPDSESALDNGVSDAQKARVPDSESALDSDLYEELKARVITREISPTFRPIIQWLADKAVGKNTQHRQLLAAAALDRMHRENVLTLNPANDGSGIKKAKYIVV